MTMSTEDEGHCSHRDCPIEIDTHHGDSNSAVEIDPFISRERVAETRGRDRYEFEELRREAGALESARKWRACTKNPGHPNFIPMGEFSMQHLPSDCQREEVVNLIDYASKLAVRLRVGNVDPNRPERFALDGSGNICTGTGTIVGITPATGLCSCGGCKGEPEKICKWWCVDILTANHVVYNSQEARHTRVDLFYDYERSQADGRMQTFWGVGVIDEYFNGDWSYVQCALHDEDLAKNLIRYLRGFTEAEKIVRELPKTPSFWHTVVVISHPHGRPKYVTVGNLKLMGRLTEYSESIAGPFICSGDVRYNADTCSGSSGAPVLWLGIELNYTKMPLYRQDDPRDGVMARNIGPIESFLKSYSFNKSYIAWLVIFAFLLLAVPSIVGLIQIDEELNFVIRQTVRGVIAGFFLWLLLFYSLRGTQPYLCMFRENTSSHIIRFQKLLFQSRVKFCLDGIDFGSTIVINVLQLLYFLKMFLELYGNDTFLLSITIIVTAYIATLILVLLLYVVFLRLENHLLRPLVLRARVFWLIGFVLVLLFSCTLWYNLFACFVVAVSPFFLLADVIVSGTQLLVAQFSCKRPGQSGKLLRLRTLNFIHSSGDDDGNYSYICFVR